MVNKKIGLKKEKSHDRRKRVERDRKAKEAAIKYVVPSILAILILTVVIFFYKFGLGSVKAIVN